MAQTTNPFADDFDAAKFTEKCIDDYLNSDAGKAQVNKLARKVLIGAGITALVIVGGVFGGIAIAKTL